MTITAIFVLGLATMFLYGANGNNVTTVENPGNVSTTKPPTCLPDGNRACHENSYPWCCSGLCHRLPHWKTGVCKSTDQKVDLSCGRAVNGSRAISNCPANMFSCSSGECLTYDKVCNVACDCPDGSDEGVYCNVPCSETTLSCAHRCHRTPEGPKCSCPQNFKLNKHGASCVEITETKANMTEGTHRTEESSPKIWLPIAITLALFLGIAALGIGYYYRKYQRVQKVLRRLTPEEIAEFLEGKARQVGEAKTDGTEVALSLPFTLTLSTDAIKITHSEVLGSGHYGIVYKGYYGNEIVAIKTFKRTVEIDEFKAVLSEAKIMAYIGDHPHVVQFIGAEVSEIMDRKLLLVSELSPYGDLLSFIRKSAPKFGTTSQYANTGDDSLTVATLASWCKQIAEAMEYLEVKRVVHGDLAARNVLLFDSFVVKITDFGLSKQLYGNAQYLMKQMRALPWKWASIELLTRHEFSTDSDIWSFGVTAWEIYTLGRPPYEDHQSCQHLMRFLQDGHRMDCPVYATSEIHEMLLQCWNEFRNLRPRFSKLKDFFEDQARKAAGRETQKNVGPVSINPGYVTLLEQEE